MTRSSLSRLAAWSIAAGTAAWALADTRWRDAEGALATPACLPLAVAAALVLAGWIDVTRRPALAFWTALGAVGQGAALQLIDAGPELGYQHNPPLQHLAGEAAPLPLALLAVQALLVAVGLARRRVELSEWLGGALGRWRLAAVGLVFVLASAPVSAQVARYPGELAVASLVHLVQLGNVLLVGLAAPAALLERFAGRLRRLLAPASDDPSGERRRGIDGVALGAALWVTLLAALLSFVSYERHPHITDEVTYVVHAGILAEGRLTAPAPPVPEAFELYLMRLDGDRWYPATPPGWPLLLALGTLVGVPWLVNPVLAGVSVLLAHALLREIADRATARLVALLMCVSPWHVFMGMNFMNHTATLALALGAALALARSRRTGAAAPAAAAGGLVAAIGSIRPLDCLVLGALLSLWALAPRSAGGRRLPIRALAACAAGGIAIGALGLAYNHQITGDPLEFPVMTYMHERWGPGSNRLGFGPDRGQSWPLDPFPGHSPVDALVNANLNTFSIHVELLGWSVGSLLLAAAALVSGPLRRLEWLMVAVVAGVFTAHFFYYYSGGPDFGARYWFLMSVPLLVLTARGLQMLGSRLGEPGAARLALSAAALCLFALLTYFPWRAIDKYHHLWGMRPDLRRLATVGGFGRSLVLIRGEAYPDYASAAVYNPVDLAGDAPVYAWDRGPRSRAALLAAYPDRPVWLVDGPTRTGGGFEVAAGPISPGSPLP